MTTPSTVRASRPSARRIARKASIIAAAGGLLTVGVAFAAWTATGSGKAGGASKARQVIELTAQTPTADLYPGANGDLVVLITNPNPYTVSLSSVEALSGITAANAGCNVADAVSYRFSSLPVNAAVAAGGTYKLTIEDGIGMDNDANDNCSDTTFDVPVKVIAASDPSAATSTAGTVTATGL